MWSLGCILYSLLSGMSAFVEPNQREKIRTGSFAPMKGGVWVTVSDVAKDLVRK